MTYTTLSCYQDFHCLAGACPDTCCAGWEIDLDGDTLERYRRLPGALGDRIRSKISSNVEITLVNGGQPVYYFIVSLE